MSKLHVVGVGSVDCVGLPEEVRLSLAGIAGQAKEGLLALAVATGLAVLEETLEWEVERVVGPMGRHDGGGRRSVTVTRGVRKPRR